MRITNYKKARNAEQVKTLFREIYPSWDETRLEMMAYDEKQASHVGTKIAFEGDQITGQANVFWINQEKGVANLGYHVNPKYHKKGIGYQLAKSLLVELSNKVKCFVVLTTADNLASQMLCRKLGFTQPGAEIEEVVRNTKKYQQIQYPYFRALETEHFKSEEMERKA